MSKKSKGIILLGILFLLIGALSLGAVVSSHRGEASERFVYLIDSAVAKTFESMKVLEDEKEQVKLKASGKFEQFNREYADFKQELKKLAEDYKAKLPQMGIFFILIHSLAGILSLLAGIGLIVHQSWGKQVAYLGVFNICIVYVFNWSVIYPLAFIADFTMKRGHALNILIDPVDPAYQVLSKYASHSTLNHMLFGYPFMICHLFFIIVVGIVLYYLSCAKVKDLLK